MIQCFSVRVSNELGLGHSEAAKYSVYVTVFQSLVIGLICMAVVLVAKDYFAYIFTSSKVMQVATSKLAFILDITMVLNNVQPVISGGFMFTTQRATHCCYPLTLHLRLLMTPVGVAIGGG